MTGQIIKKNADLFSVMSGGEIFELKARGTLKKDGLFVGDFVEFDATINKLLPRKNLLIRPPIANLDKIFIVLCPIPKPDFLLVDKILLCAFCKGIMPIIVINKQDICPPEFVKEVKSIYKNVAKVLVCSAKEGSLEGLKKQIDGVCAFAGQSAVGKSSLINALLGESVNEVGGLSAKIERGKQTTRLVSLFACGKGLIADTAGFSSFELGLTTDLSSEQISRFYPDFLPYLGQCKYRSCNHKNGQCGIIENVKNGKINKIRYQNYIKIFDNLSSFKPKY